MTEYELADVISAYSVQGGTFFTIWLTILCAYAITAHVAGRDLSAYQIRFYQLAFPIYVPRLKL